MVLSQHLTAGHYFVLFPKEGQSNRPLLKFVHTVPGNGIRAVNIQTGEHEDIGYDEQVLVIHT